MDLQRTRMAFQENIAALRVEFKSSYDTLQSLQRQVNESQTLPMPADRTLIVQADSETLFSNCGIAACE